MTYNLLIGTVNPTHSLTATPNILHLCSAHVVMLIILDTLIACFY